MKCCKSIVLRDMKSTVHAPRQRRFVTRPEAAHVITTLVYGGPVSDRLFCYFIYHFVVVVVNIVKYTSIAFLHFVIYIA